MEDNNAADNFEVLIVGGDSVIGSALVDAYTKAGTDVWKTTHHKSSVNNRCFFVDLENDFPEAFFPDKTVKLAFICAAVTSIAVCNAEPERTKKINVDNTLAVVQYLLKQGAFVVFLSSNAVFDGELAFPKIDQSTNPLTVYGKQKAAAEKKLKSLGGEHLAILRISKVIHPKWPLLLQWVSDLKNGSAVYPFADMVMAPVSVAYSVSVLQEIGERKIAGMYHLSANVDITYEAAALYIAGKLSADEKLIIPVSYKEKGITHSLKHSTLNCGELQQFGLDTPSPFMAFDNLIN